MKKTINTLFIAVGIILLQSCKEDCNLDCFTPPEPLVFELVDSINNENLFTNNTYNENDIKVINTTDNKVVTHKFIRENDQNLLMLNTIGWQTEQVALAILIANETIFTLYVDVERLDGDCCSYTKYNLVDIRDVTYRLNQQSGIYTIIIE